MLTPDDLRAMTPAQLGETFDELAQAYYGTRNYAPQLTQDFDIGLTSVYRWKQTGAPWAVIYALEAWTSDLGKLTWAAKTSIAVLNRALEARAAAEPAAQSDA